METIDNDIALKGDVVLLKETFAYWETRVGKTSGLTGFGGFI